MIAGRVSTRERAFSGLCDQCGARQCRYRPYTVLEGVEPDNTHSLEELTADLNSGQVETLLILGPNPV